MPILACGVAGMVGCRQCVCVSVCVPRGVCVPHGECERQWMLVCRLRLMPDVVIVWMCVDLSVDECVCTSVYVRVYVGCVAMAVAVWHVISGLRSGDLRQQHCWRVLRGDEESGGIARVCGVYVAACVVGRVDVCCMCGV